MSYAISADGGQLACELCPHRCSIPRGKFGICNVRQNSDGELSLPYFGNLSALATDPIEKKPLYHFYPGSTILSAGFFGCNFRCPFCQNYTISQNTGVGTTLSPEALVDRAIASGSSGIAYTYSEPLVHFEYVIEAARLAKRNGIANVIVTNGYINEKPAEELLEYIDAANIDLKAFADSFYKQEIKGTIEPVKRFIELAAAKTHIEITTLVIPTKNDSDGEIDSIARYISSIDRSIPLHLSCYYPTYKYQIRATPPERVLELVVVAKKHLDYVYPGNVGGRDADTQCPKCGNTLIRRRGYRTQIKGISDGKCSSCGHETGIIGA